MKNILALGFVLAFSALCLSCTKGKKEFVTIGTGGVTGVYYPTGGAIAKMMNNKTSEYGIRASVESTAGSVFNVNAVLSGDLEFGVVQSDRQYQAVKGLNEWKEKGPQKKLRSVFSIHPEAITLVASVDSGIKKITDLKGKKVNIGDPGSGQRGNAIDVLKTAGIDYEKDIQAESLKASEAPRMLQDGRIEAFFYTVGHPSGAITEATSGGQKVRFVEISGMESLLEKNPFYAVATISNKVYPQAANDKPTKTIGVKATFVTSSDTPDDVVYAITKEVFENFETFKELHPAFKELTKESMLEALSAPIHQGALKYFQEAGLGKNIPERLRTN